MFTVTSHKGVHFEFQNGLIVSVQWGPGNYCDRKHDPWTSPAKEDKWASDTAEIAVWRAENGLGGMLPISSSGDTVAGYITADQVARVLACCAAFKGLDDADLTERILEILEGTTDAVKF